MTEQIDSKNIILVDLENTLIFQEKSDLENIGSPVSEDQLFLHKDSNWYQNTALINTLKKLNKENGYQIYISTSSLGTEVAFGAMEEWEFITTVLQEPKSGHADGMLGVFHHFYPDKEIENCILIGDSLYDQCPKAQCSKVHNLLSIQIDPKAPERSDGIKVCHTVNNVKQCLATFTGNKSILPAQQTFKNMGKRIPRNTQYEP